MTGRFILGDTAWLTRVRNSDAVVARVERFYSFSLSAAGTKALGLKRWHLGLMPCEWVKVK